MARTAYTDPLEYYEIHSAACRWRRQGLVCSACADLAERAATASALTRHEKEVA